MTETTLIYGYQRVKSGSFVFSITSPHQTMISPQQVNSCSAQIADNHGIPDDVLSDVRPTWLTALAPAFGCYVLDNDSADAVIHGEL